MLAMHSGDDEMSDVACVRVERTLIRQIPCNDVVFQRGVREYLLFHVSIIPLKLQEYRSDRSLTLQETHRKINAPAHLIVTKLEHQRSNTGTYCAFGTYTSNEGETQCHDCAANFYNPYLGASHVWNVRMGKHQEQLLLRVPHVTLRTCSVEIVTFRSWEF